ncbi:glycosyltransferase family A protein [Demequina sp. SYSU T00039]|uniref:Glycosyltransferase family A protein n=1 Tax=Demequina lignilytica TaxID=3051663 RepID=A0AAW7M907_9MICO|nr:MULTISPECIES: glycosyltransferase family A protein [unclassified Demequina]MDN4477424.1 glycosyltransferase family A protein [Demequina sp. SYSU T00039-1]MDN4488225.1 glycosyltransferase family A protein [Demequina sp. SYSU T00039]
MGELVSVIMPVYNGEDFLGAAIDSVLVQTHTDLEVIVIDDGSQDGTVALVEAIEDPRVRCLKQQNQGVAAARNTGIANARGSIIAFLDHDDAWVPDKLELQLEMMRETGAVLVGALMTYLGPRGPMAARAGEIADGQRTKIAEARLMPFPPSSMIVRRDVLEQAGPFDVELNHNTGPIDDLDMVAKIARLGDVVTYPEPLGFYRVHGAANTFAKFFEMQRGTRYLQARYDGELDWDEWKAANPATSGEIRLDKAKFYYRRAGFAYAGGKWVDAAVSGATAFALAPKYVVTRSRRQMS